jgi:CDP-diacylglycerol--serine O-phosphatidyltransferase
MGMIISMSGLGHPYIGMLFMLFSGLCDAFDGRVARTKKNRTQLERDFGVQIDSLSDLVAFGVLPASVGVSLLRASERYSDVPHRIVESGKLCWYPVLLIAVALLYVLAAMIRLAYFNATEDERRQEKEESGSEYFTGLPVTTAALVFPLVLLLHYFLRFDLSIIYFVVMLCMAVLFLCNFKIRKPGKLLLGVMVGFGGLELLTFLLIRLLGHK